MLLAYAELEPAVQGERYRPYREVLAETARRVAARLGWNLTAEGAQFLPESLPEWPPFPDTNAALERLAAAGYRLGILSNVDDDLLAATRRHFTAGFDLIITAQQVGSYKPAPGHFLAAREQIGEARWLHVAQSTFHDVVPARSLGVPTAWINRKRETPPDRGRPTYELPDLAALVRDLTPRSPFPAGEGGSRFPPSPAGRGARGVGKEEPMASNGFDLTGKAALVTGGTSGLGRAIARGLARAGARVLVGSRDTAKVADAERELRELGAGHGGIALDVADEASVEAAVSTAVAELGGLDILVNAAGMTLKAPSMELSRSDWERVLEINLTGTFLCCRAAGRVMKERGGGAILNIASLASYRALADVLPYCVSKAGVAMLTMSLANDWARYQIRVNALAPGVFPTPLNRHLIEGTPRGEWFRRQTPMDRFGEAEELVGAAIYLVSPAASYTTGHVLAVDGGFLARGVGG